MATRSMVRATGFALLVLVVLFVMCTVPQTREEPSAEVPTPTPAHQDHGEHDLRSLIDKSERDLDAAHKRALAELGDDEGEPADSSFFEEFFAIKETKASLQNVRDALDTIETTEHDRKGIAALAGGTLEEAEAHFRRSIRQAPRRPFPVYSLGMIAFDQSRPTRAKDWFAQALAAEPRCESAALMKRLCVACEATPPATDAHLLATFAHTYQEAMQELKPDHELTFADMSFPPLASDLVIRKSLDLFLSIGKAKEDEFKARFASTDDPDEEMAMSLVLEGTDLGGAWARATAGLYPDRRDFQVFALLVEHFSEDESPDSELLAAARHLEPDNGALMLLTVDKGQLDAEGAQHVPALTDEECALLHQAAEAPDFVTYELYKYEEQLAIHRDLARPFAPASPFRLTGPAMHMLRVFRRARTRIEAELQQGNIDLATRIARDVQRIADRYAGEQDIVIGQLIATGFHRLAVAPFDDWIGPKKIPVGIRVLFRARLPAVRAEAHQGLWAAAAPAVARLPSRRLYDAYCAWETSSEVRDETYERLLALRRGKIREDTVTRLQEALESDWLSVDCTDVVLLGDIADERARGVLRSVRDGAKSAFARYLAATLLEEQRPTALP